MIRLVGGLVLNEDGTKLVPGDLLVDASGARPANGSAEGEALDCSGCWVVPGFVDMRCHLREPGEEHKEDIQSGLRAAARGGFTAVCALPGTTPVHDVRAVTEQMLARASGGPARLWPIGAITKGLRGKELAELADMLDAGAVAFSDDRYPIADRGLLRRAMEYARSFDALIALHCGDPSLDMGHAVHEGVFSVELGLRASPASAETVAVDAACELALVTGARVHLSHLSAARSVESLRRAKARGARLSADVSPHHLRYTDANLVGFSPMYKVLPPLRAEADRQALLEGINDRTIDAIATDHAPHAPLDKDCEFSAAEAGVIGLELALPTLMPLIDAGELQAAAALHALSNGPSRLLDQRDGFSRGDVTVVDPKADWVVDKLASKSQNSPLYGEAVVGAARFTLAYGSLQYRAGDRP
ncbi:MAG: dihydroorotase [Myxococcota bacterium]